MRTTRPCVVCGGRCTHKHGIVVGRKPSGMPRLLCGSRACIKSWKLVADTVRSTWIENRKKFDRAKFIHRRLA